MEQLQEDNGPRGGQEGAEGVADGIEQGGGCDPGALVPFLQEAGAEGEKGDFADGGDEPGEADHAGGGAEAVEVDAEEAVVHAVGQGGDQDEQEKKGGFAVAEEVQEVAKGKSVGGGGDVGQGEAEQGGGGSVGEEQDGEAGHAEPLGDGAGQQGGGGIADGPVHAHGAEGHARFFREAEVEALGERVGGEEEEVEQGDEQEQGGRVVGGKCGRADEGGEAEGEEEDFFDGAVFVALVAPEGLGEDADQGAGADQSADFGGGDAAGGEVDGEEGDEEGEQGEVEVVVAFEGAEGGHVYNTSFWWEWMVGCCACV